MLFLRISTVSIFYIIFHHRFFFFLLKIIIYFIFVYYGYVGYGQNSDYLSSQSELFVGTIEKVWPGAERKLRNILLKIIREIINPLLNMEPRSPSIFTDIYIYL